MSQPPDHLARRLRLAADAYASSTGREVAVERLDARHEPVRGLYRTFGRRWLRVDGIGANDAEWLALELGLKTVVREVLSLDRLEVLRTRAAASGWLVDVVPFTVREDAHAGWLLAGEVEERSEAADAQIIVYCGPHAAQLKQARACDETLLGTPCDPVAHRPFTTEMGRLLGYPACCVSAYTRHDEVLDNHGYLTRALADTREPRALLNNLGLGAFHYLPWSPCRFDCEASLAWAGALEAHLARTNPRACEAIARMLAMPRLYLDDRRQVILDGQADAEGTLRYSRAAGPFAFDGGGASGLFDWAFHVDVIARFLAADGLRAAGSGWELLSGDEVIDPLDDLRDAMLFVWS